MRRLLAFLPAVAFFFASCAFYNEKNPGNPDSVVPGTVTWGQVYSQVMIPRCATCHSSGGAGFDCTNYESVVSKISDVRDRAITKQDMPADSPLTPYESTLLQAWINEGTPAGGGGP